MGHLSGRLLCLGFFLLLPATARGAQTEKLGRPVQPPYWLKLYPLSPYAEYWTLTVRVRDFDKDLPRVLKAFERSGASLTLPLENFAGSRKGKVQQLSCRAPLQAAHRALKDLKGVGAVSEPFIRPSGEAVSLPEVQEKIAKLIAEKQAHAKELAAMPAVSAATDELLEHLLMVEAVSSKPAEALLNITVEEKP